MQRILDEAATNRPPMGLFDSSGFGPAPAASQTATAQIDGGGITPLSTIPLVAHPPGALLAAQIAPALRVTGFDFSPSDFRVAAKALTRAAYESADKNYRDLSTPSPSSTTAGPRPTPIPVPYGELTDFEVVKRIPGGGASDDKAYRHWHEGSSEPLRIEFSGVDIETDLKSRIGESAAGGLSGTFRNKINESLLTGRPAFVDTTAQVDTHDLVRGRSESRLTGWVTASGDKWQFDGTATGKPEPFDFNSDPRRGFLTNAGTIYAGNRGHLRGAMDYQATYAGAIQMRAGGPIRR